jgi:signal peptidase II
VSAAVAGWLRALAVAGGVVALDQITKYAARSSLGPDERVDVLLGIDLVDVSNRGIAFGFFGDGGALLLAVTVAALALMLVWFALDPSRPGLWLAIGLLAGGALGNLADRARQGAVTDFIDPPAWPAFNLADVAITFGALALVLIAFVGDGHEADERAPNDGH